jgi:sulfate transport system ATP-binding protein
MSITIQHVTKRFGDFVALEDVSVEVPSGSLVALLGPSGSGKTTLLRIIAGLESADEGEVFLHGAEASRQDVRDRNIGFVFQHYALFRHLTVAQNVGFALKMRRRPKAEIKERVYELLRLVQLEQVRNRYPAQLSGGQRQRIALARALAARPNVLLLDEPFGALDARVRQELRDWLRRLHDEIHVTSVFVTHDQEEALELADRVVVMSRGKIEQVGTPEEVYHHPANPFVMRFLGQVNLFHGRMEEGRLVVAASDSSRADDSVVGYVRPHDLELTREPNDEHALAARVVRINAAGFQVRIEVDLTENNQRLEVLLAQDEFRALTLKEGESVFVRPKQIKVFEGDYVI